MCRLIAHVTSAGYSKVNAIILMGFAHSLVLVERKGFWSNVKWMMMMMCDLYELERFEGEFESRW